MADPTGGGGFEAARLALKALSKVVDVLLNSKQGNTPRLTASQKIQQLGPQAYARALELEKMFQKMLNDLAALRDRGYDVSLPLSECRKQGWFYKFGFDAPYKLLREFDKRINTAASLCEDLFADVLAIGECSESEDEIAKSIAEARQTVQSLRGVSTNDDPMDRTVNALLEEAQELVRLTRNL